MIFREAAFQFTMSLSPTGPLRARTAFPGAIRQQGRTGPWAEISNEAPYPDIVNLNTRGAARKRAGNRVASGTTTEGNGTVLASGGTRRAKIPIEAPPSRIGDFAGFIALVVLDFDTDMV